MVIYKTINLINGKIYIGKDKRNNDWYLGSGKILMFAIKKYGKENFKKEILEECNSIEHMREREIHWIAFFNSTDRGIGYNIQLGGDGGFNYGHLTSEQLQEVKNKISESVKKSYQEGRHKITGFVSKTAIAAAKKLYELNKKDNFETFTKKQNETKLKNGTHPGCEEMKKINSESVKEFWKNNPDVKKRMAENVSKAMKGKSKLSIFVEKYGEELGIEKYNEFLTKMKTSKKGKTPWNKGIKQKDYEVKK
jgi:hypothetical protein